MIRTTRKATQRAAAPVLALALLGGLAGCGSDDDEDAAASASPTATQEPSPSPSPSASPSASASASPSSTDVAVAADDEESCTVDKSSAPAGTVVFKITNKGEKETELYVVDPSGKILAEREDIEPGDSADLTLTLSPGRHELRCKPGVMDDAAKSTIEITGQAVQLSDEAKAAVQSYRDYVAAQVDDTIAATEEFVAAVKAGDVAKAKSLYAPSRVGWESIEPVAESFGDLDPKVDAREADLEEGDTWTGWHKIEKALWKDNTTKDMSAVGDQLLKDLEELEERVPTAEITPTTMANGAKELLDEVASGKVTGEEEAFSHTDLVDFKANVDGAKKVFDLLKGIAEKKDPGLVATLTQEFSDVEAALKKYEEGDGYISYDKVTDAQRKELTDVVNALGEPLSKLAAAVV